SRTASSLCFISGLSHLSRVFMALDLPRVLVGWHRPGGSGSFSDVIKMICAALLVLAGAARGELVELPPEVPVQAYRRLVFAVNLNPVPWALVRKELAALGSGLPLPHAARLAEAVKPVLDEPGRIEQRALDPGARR